jgi:hypothetical protein
MFSSKHIFTRESASARSFRYVNREANLLPSSGLLCPLHYLCKQELTNCAGFQVNPLGELSNSPLDSETAKSQAKCEWFWSGSADCGGSLDMPVK